MKTHSGILETAFDVPPPGFPNGSAPEFDIAPLSHRPRLRLGLAVRYLVSGLAYSVVIVAIMFVLNGIEFLPLRFAVVSASFSFPALIMALYVAGLRWYFILFLAVFWIWLLYLAAPESIDLIGIMVGPSFFLALIVVFTVGIGLARAIVKIVGRVTAGSSEFMMQHDLLWLFQTVWMIGLG